MSATHLVMEAKFRIKNILIHPACDIIISIAADFRKYLKKNINFNCTVLKILIVFNCRNFNAYFVIFVVHLKIEPDGFVTDDCFSEQSVVRTLGAQFVKNMSSG